MSTPVNSWTNINIDTVKTLLNVIYNQYIISQHKDSVLRYLNNIDNEYSGNIFDETTVKLFKLKIPNNSVTNTNGQTFNDFLFIEKDANNLITNKPKKERYLIISHALLIFCDVIKNILGKTSIDTAISAITSLEKVSYKSYNSGDTDYTNSKVIILDPNIKYLLNSTELKIFIIKMIVYIQNF